MNISRDETIQIVDRQNRKTMHRARSIMRRDKLIHRASYILVFNDKDELFLQKRTRSKDIYPGYWDVAAGGVVLADESYEVSASRELAEELGITDVPLEFLFDHYYEDEANRVWGRIFTCRHDGPFILQEAEVESGTFIAVEDALRLSQKESFTPDGVEILMRLKEGSYPTPTGTFFLHGLDSSGQGTKGRFFAEHFPHVHCPNFVGTLEDRLTSLTNLCEKEHRLILIGSSFGGLMATSYAVTHPEKISRIVLLAPALNFAGYHVPARQLSTPCLLVIGRNDTVTPADLVIPQAKATFADLEICIEDDDHMLHKSFMNFGWSDILST